MRQPGRLLPGLEIQGLGRQRAIGEGDLLAAGAGLDVVMHAAEQHVDLKPRLVEIFEQAFGERAVGSIAVLRHLPVFGGIGD